MTKLTAQDNGNWVFGSSSAGARYGSAWRTGKVLLARLGAPTLVLKCSTYRKAQRKLLQWVKGYNVC